MNSHQTLAPVPYLAALLAAACGTPPAFEQPPMAEATAGIVIDGGDTESLARLTVQLPTGSCLAGGNCSRPLKANPLVELDTLDLVLGKEHRFVAGTYTLSVDGENKNTVRFSRGERRVMTLAVARSRCTKEPLPAIAKTDFGHEPRLGHSSCPTELSHVSEWSRVTLFHDDGRCATPPLATWVPSSLPADCSTARDLAVWGFQLDGACFEISDRSGEAFCTGLKTGSLFRELGRVAKLAADDRAYVPGTYSYRVSAGSPVAVTFNEGSMPELAISLPVEGQLPPLFTTTIAFAEARTLPDADSVTISSSVSGERGYTLPTRTTAPLALQAYQNPKATYTLRAAGRTLTLDQSRPNGITLRRIDVTDITVGREDGTSYTTQATYELYFGGARVAGPLRSPSGLDVLPGDYELVLSYSTNEGPRVQRYTLRL